MLAEYVTFNATPFTYFYGYVPANRSNEYGPVVFRPIVFDRGLLTKSVQLVLRENEMSNTTA